MKVKNKDLVLHKKEKEVFKVVEKRQVDKKWMYTLQNTSDKKDYKRYYESKLKKECTKIAKK